MPRYANLFTEVSALGSFESEIEKLLRQLKAGSSSGSATTSTSTSVSDTYASILVDNGNGRSKSGLRSLELLSILRSGTAPANLFLFDNVIYAGSPSDFDTTDTVKLTDIVVRNLGMQTVVQALADETTAEFTGICNKIALLVKTGKYTSDQYDSYITRESRRLVKLYIELQK